MKLLPLVILVLNSFCAFSKIPHEIVYVVGCFENCMTDVQFEFDGEKILYVDFEKHEIEYKVPGFIELTPSEVFGDMNVYKNAIKANKTCPLALAYLIIEEKSPPEENDPPENVLYPSEDVQPGVENSLICFVNHFYPPSIKVNWTKNGLPVSEGVSLSRYYPNDDQTFHQFATLKFTPREGDIYSCTVEHSALERPITKIWEPDLSYPSIGPDVYCGGGLALGLFGVAVGTFLMVKGHHGQ